ncbi:MAG: Ig-like domain-containing protein [Dermatophilaceae bacterium]
MSNRSQPSLRRLLTVGAVPLAVAGMSVATGSANATAAAGVTFTVNSTGDAPDSGKNGQCKTAANVCTLRAAIMESNWTSQPVTINFNIPGSGVQTINVASRLPNVTAPGGLTINGYSQPGASANTSSLVSNAQIKVEIRGRGPMSFDGLVYSTKNNVVKGLALYDFHNQIIFSGLNADNNKVLGSYICTNAAGTVSSPASEGQIGILLQKGASSNVIGTPSAADRNVVSGCGNRGITMSFSPTSYNVIQNNIVGLNPSGTRPLRNGSQGVDINYTDFNLVGGDNPGQGNVLSGNGGSGIEDSHGGKNHDNTITGNLIGTTPSGEVASWAGNLLWGIRFEGPKFCGTAGHSNPGGCTLADVPEGLPNHNTARNNVIVSNVKGGVLIDKGHNNVTLSGNWIGANKAGADGGSGVAGVQIQRGSFGMNITGNVIAHNPVGVQISSTGGFPPGDEQRTYGNTISRNSTFDNTGIKFVWKTSPTLVQNAMAAPALSAASGKVIKGTTCSGCKVELFVGENKTAKSGKTYLASVTASTSGAFSIKLSAATGSPITATSTDKSGNTSPFQVPVTLKG